MCGISGYSVSSFDSSSVNWLSKSIATLTHRGPDDSGIFTSPNKTVGLAHSRLSIIDLSSTASQPMLNCSNDVALVFNGEIYNYRELREKLISLGFSFRGSSDTEVLLCLYIYYRSLSSEPIDSHSFSSMLREINGIFSFAIWDQRFDALFLARDALGVKPLYIRQDSSSIFFASELKALPLHDVEIDCQALDKYLSYLWCPGESTPVVNISKIPPGAAVRISRGSLLQRFQWYSLPVTRRKALPNGPMKRSDAIHLVENGLRDAVHRQMISDVPVGAFLSGGLDSSSIVTFAKELNPQLPCFTIDATGDSGNSTNSDLHYAQIVASHLDVPLNIVRVDPYQMASCLEEMVWHLDEPLADPASLNVLFISRLAREQGCKVLLSGSGGDDLFTGYRRHYALNSERYWSWLPIPVRSRLKSLSYHLPVNYPFLRRLRKSFSSADLDSNSRLLNYFRWIERTDLQPLYSDRFRQSLSDSMDHDPLNEFLEALPLSVPRLERMLGLEQRYFLADHNLAYTDKMSMAMGVEVRVPFLDLDLVEIAARIPTSYKQRGREGKWVLKKAMEPYLPRNVIYRPKTGFGVPLRRWLRYDLHDWLLDILSHDRVHHRGLFDPSAVHRLISANFAGQIDASYTLLSLACIELWCQHFLDRGTHKLV